MERDGISCPLLEACLYPDACKTTLIQALPDGLTYMADAHLDSTGTKAVAAPREKKEPWPPTLCQFPSGHALT
eukprot:1041744-Prymnesium_polylepis.1